MTRFAQIISTGRYIPEKVITNAELEEMLGEPVGDWLVENVGIHERHIMMWSRWCGNSLYYVFFMRTTFHFNQFLLFIRLYKYSHVGSVVGCTRMLIKWLKVRLIALI